MKSTNVFRDIPDQLPRELTEILLAQDDLRIERIVSRGHCSPTDFWYDQQETEWVLVLAGSAHLHFEANGQIVHLGAGDYLRIPARTRHRVEWTDPDQYTIWLAVFYPEESDPTGTGEDLGNLTPRKAENETPRIDPRSSGT